MSSGPSRRLAAVLTAAALIAPGAALVGVPPALAAGEPSPFVVEAQVAAPGAGAAGTLDLSEVGTTDWVHVAGTGIDRRAGAPVVTVENRNPDEPIGTLTDSPYRFRWTDGSPTAVTEGVTTGGVFSADRSTSGPTEVDAGYTVTIPAADHAQRALVVAGAWQAAATVTVSTDAGSPALFSTQVQAAGAARVTLYTITLRPGVGAVLTSAITETSVPDGNVSLAAVAVAELDLGADAVTLSSQSTPEVLDLTAAGGLDWLHLDGPDLDQAATGDALSVTNRAPQIPIATQSDNPVRYRWTNGTPVAVQEGTRTGGVFMADGTDFSRPSGFDLDIASGERARTVQLVAGAWQASATLSVTLNGDPVPVATSGELTAGGSAVARLFVLTLRPGDSARVSVQLTGRGHDHGNVTLGGAAVSETPSAEDGIRALLDEIAGTDLTAADAAMLDQLDRETAAARALLDDPGASDADARMQQVLLGGALRSARDSVVAAQYAFDTSPGLVSSFGWEGDRHAPIAYIDGSYLLRDRGELMVTFGVPEIPGEIAWRNAEGYLPAFISEFSKRGLDVSIQSFADEVTVDGDRFEIAYSRMSVENTTDAPLPLPVVSRDLVPLTDAARTATQVAPGETVVRDYAIAADRFAGTYAWPDADEILALGDYDTHYAHMRDYWEDRLADIAEITELPNPELVDAYKAGYIYTLIIRDDIAGEKRLHVGENGYDVVFDHDTIGIVATLLTIGDFTYAQDYLATLPAQLQYDDAKWKYSWPFALYLQRTGDLDFIRSEFANIRTQTHKIETDRIGGGTGIMKQTWAIDSLGHWTIDNWSALAGLTTYRYLAEQLGETAEAEWAQAEYDDLFAVVTQRLQQTIDEHDLDYIPISMVEPNEDGPRSDPRDANWASMFLFGRWAWDGYLFGAEQDGLMLDMIDGTYAAGFARRADVSDTDANFGGYPHGYFSSAYNAGYGSSALRGEAYRDIGIRAYEFMIDEAQSGPFGWWEGVDYPASGSPWDIEHARGGGGSNQHMWGQSTATKVLFDSLVAQKSDGTLILGRGVPDAWLVKGEEIAVDRYPVAGGGRVGVALRSEGSAVDVTISGSLGEVQTLSLELGALRDNIASVEVPGAVVDRAAGTVQVPAQTGTFRVVLERAVGADGEALAVAVDGDPRVGSTLSATLTPGWTATDVAWLRDGEPIAGAGGPAYTLTSADAGAMIRVRATASLPGWADSVAESVAVGPVVTDGGAPGPGDPGDPGDPGEPGAGDPDPGDPGAGDPGSGGTGAGNGSPLAVTGPELILLGLAAAVAAIAVGGAAVVARRRGRA